jgi:hypothetical protein
MGRAAGAAGRRAGSRGGGVSQASVIQGLLKAAAEGSAPAARELRAWLAERPTQQGQDDEKLTVLQPEDMTPEQLERARAWELRRIARLEKRHADLRRLREEWRKRQACVQVEETSPEAVSLWTSTPPVA